MPNLHVAIELLELASFREGCAFASLEYSPMPLESLLETVPYIRACSRFHFQELLQLFYYKILLPLYHHTCNKLEALLKI